MNSLNSLSSQVLFEMNASGRARVAGMIRSQLEGASEKAPEMSRERIGPWISKWTMDVTMRQFEYSTDLAIAAVRAGDAFPEAVETLAPFLSKNADEHKDNQWVDRVLSETDLPEHHPKDVLPLLDLAASTTYKWPPQSFRGVLQRIAKA